MQTSPLLQSLRPSGTALGVLTLTATLALWGLVFVAPAIAHELPPALLAGLRYLLHGLASAVVLARLAKRRGGATALADGRLWARAAVHGATGFVGYYVLLTTAVRVAGPTLVVLVMAVGPVVYTLAGRPGVPWRRLALPMVAIVIGGALATVDGPVADVTTGRLVGATLLVVAAIAIWTWYGIDNARTVADPELDLTVWTGMTGVAAGLLSLPLVAFGLTRTAAPTALVTPTNVLTVVVLALLCTTVANRLWNTASRQLRPSVVGPLLVLETAFALGYAHAVEGVLPAARTLTGEALLLVGATACLLALRPSTRRSPAQRSPRPAVVLRRVSRLVRP